MIEVLDGLPEGVVGVEAVGEVERARLRDRPDPGVRGRTRAQHAPVHVVFVAGERFEGFEAATWAAG